MTDIKQKSSSSAALSIVMAIVTAVSTSPNAVAGPFRLDDSAVASPDGDQFSDESERSQGIAELFREIEIGGYLNVAYAYNFNSAERGGSLLPETPFRVFDVFHNEFTVHNAALYISRAPDESTPVGFSFAATTGKDSATTQSPNIAFGGNDLDVLEANVQVRVPDQVDVVGGATLTFGKFLTSAGAELIDAPYNDSISRSLLFGFAIPFVHTGAKISAPLLSTEGGDEILSGYLGIVNGWGNQNVGSSGGGNFPVWLSSVTLTPGGDLEPALTANYFVGEVTSAGNYRSLVDLVASLKVAKLTFLLNADWQSDQSGSAGGGYSNLWGVAGVARYDLSESWFAAVRLEHFDDHDGAAFGNPNLRIFDATATVGWKPFENLLLRGEIRVDIADERIYENSSRFTQTTAAFDASFLF